MKIFLAFILLISLNYSAQIPDMLSSYQEYFAFNKGAGKFEKLKSTNNKCTIISKDLPSKRMITIKCGEDVTNYYDLKGAKESIPEKLFIFSAKDTNQNFKVLIFEPNISFKVTDLESLVIYTITGY